MTQPNAVPDFLAADVADMEANPVQPSQTEAPAPTPAPEAEQVENVPAEQQAPPTPDIEAIDGEDRGQFIRKAALYEERQRRKEATERSREWERRYTEDMRKAQERLETLFRNAQQQNNPQPQAPQIPSLEEDPIGHFKAQNEELQRKLREQEEWRKSLDQRNEQATRVQQISQDIQRQEAEFAAVNPDYYQAHEHLQNAWVAEAKAMGIPDQDIPEAIRARSIETVQIAQRLNRNPAEVAYQRAQALGYKGPQAAPAAKAPQAKGPDLDRIAKGQAVAKSPSAAAGTPAASLQSIEALLALTEDEFASQFGSSDNKNWEKRMRAIMGAQ